MSELINVIQADGTTEVDFLKKVEERNRSTNDQVTSVVKDIIENVRINGDAAVREYTIRFDGQAPDCFEVSQDVLTEAVKTCDPAFVETLRKAAANIRDFHERQKQQSWLNTKENGVILGQRIRGLARVGLYVPGGTAAYPSSVLMNAIPAKIAGVKELIMVTPPQKDGKPNPAIMAAAMIAGVDRVFLMGGAQAVAALAYGTESVPKVDKIVGPGNIFVATAKKLLYGIVDIDMIAGPSEILVLADDSANPKYLAADLMSQAEHDKMASAILVTTSQTLANATVQELARQVQTLSRKEIIEESLRNFGVIIVHLEVCCQNPLEYIGKLDNAGSVFLGNYSPEPLGDYFAGPNHVLPTSGTARFFSPLSVDSFVKKSSFIYYTDEALRADKDDIIRFANTEGLTAHANSIIVRY